jgi:predicted TIM-barrel fold metal-dependent hydrolase
MEVNDEEKSYKILEDHFKQGFCGIKIQPSIHLIKIPKDIKKMVSFIQDYDRNFPIFIHQSPKFSYYSGTSTKDFAKLAEMFPDLQIILGHAALAMELAIDISFNLKKYENILFETSCSIPLGILSLIRNIGHHRIIFGSDAPTTNPLSLEIEKILCLPISNDQKQDILYNNIDDIMNK